MSCASQDSSQCRSPASGATMNVAMMIPSIPRLRFGDYIRESASDPGVRAWRRWVISRLPLLGEGSLRTSVLNITLWTGEPATAWLFSGAKKEPPLSCLSVGWYRRSWGGLPSGVAGDDY